MNEIFNNILSHFFFGKRFVESQVAEEPIAISINSPEILEETKDTAESKEQDLFPIEQICHSSLLDNDEYISLAEQCCDILHELDLMYKQIPNDQVNNFIFQLKTRIREALMLSGATLIDEETEFNLLRHQTVDGGIVKNGTSITETVEPGVEIDGRVMVKAKVII